MKSRIILTLAAASVLLCSCRKDTPADSWVNNENLPVPIEFAGSGFSVATKAAVTVLPGAPIGILGTDLKDGTLLINHLAQCNDNNLLEFVDEIGGEETPQYYPLRSENNFSFYGYHLDTEEIGGAYEPITNAFYKEFTLGGVDVLWARSVATPIDGIEGYNARYSRYVRSLEPALQAQYYPSLNFSHRTTALHFFAKASDAAAESSFSDMKVQITACTLTNVPTRARLIIMDATNPGREGSIEVSGMSGENIVREELSAVPTVAGTEISDGFFLLPGTYADTQFQFTVTTEPDNVQTTYTIDHLPLPAGAESFEMGKSYNFNIILKSFDKIEIKASLAAWENGWTDPDDHSNDLIVIE